MVAEREEMMEFQSAYSRSVRPVVTIDPSEERTKQSFKDDCDVNKIIKRYKATGVVTHLNAMEARYGDLTGIDFDRAMEIVTNARGLFDELPSGIRKRFNNDPGLFLDFMDNPENAEEMVKLGLGTKREVGELHPETVVSEPVAGEEGVE